MDNYNKPFIWSLYIPKVYKYIGEDMFNDIKVLSDRKHL